jgi:hypothetical protein
MKIVKRISIIVFFLILKSYSVNSQDIISPVSAIKEKKEFIYGIDNRRTHINGQSALIYGLYVGIGYGGKLRFKGGFSLTPYERGKSVDEFGVIKKNRLLFLNIGEELDYLIYKKIRLTAYLQTGIGFNYHRTINAISKIEVAKGKDIIVPIEVGTHIGYDILPWFRLKVGGGWRFVRPEYSSDISGYYIKTGCYFNSKLFFDTYRKKK